jgi:hypothetical protein
MLTEQQRAERQAIFPSPGVHYDVPADRYHGIRYASATYLRLLSRSPSHARDAMLHPPAPSDEKIFGQACHLSVLQPDLLDEFFVTAGTCAAIKKSDGQVCGNPGKVCRGGAWFCDIRGHDPEKGVAASDGRQVLSSEDFNHVVMVGAAVRAHPAAAQILEAANGIEVSATWPDPTTGVMCKMRADILADSLDVIGDLKTTADASPKGFAARAWAYRYDLQAAHYLRGMGQTSRAYGEFRFIAAEKVPPYAVAVYSLPADDAWAALDELDGLLKLWKQCEQDDGAGWSRGYSDAVMPLELPAWAKKQRGLALSR